MTVPITLADASTGLTGPYEIAAGLYGNEIEIHDPEWAILMRLTPLDALTLADELRDRVYELTKERYESTQALYGLW